MLMMLLRQSEIPSEPGTYLLILYANRSRRVSIGKLGRFAAEAGFYYYVGSAFGSGGLKARLGRHCRRTKSLRWHIDYLRERTALAGAYWSTSLDKREAYWVERLNEHAALTCPFGGFGASDSKQASHLFFCPDLLKETTIRWLLGDSLTGGFHARFADMSSER